MAGVRCSRNDDALELEEKFIIGDKPIANRKHTRDAAFLSLSSSTVE